MTHRFSLVLVPIATMFLVSCQTVPVGVQEELERRRQALANRDDELLRAHSQLADFERQTADLQTKLASLEAEVAQLTRGAHTLTLTREELERERTALRARAADLGSQLAQAQQRLAQVEATNAGLREANAELLRSQDQLAASLTATQGQLQTRVAELVRQNGELGQRIGALSQEKDALALALGEQSRQLAGAVEQLKRQLRVEIERGDLDVVLYRDVIIVNIKDTVVFQPDSAVLRVEFSPILQRIADAFARFPDKVIRVEGHTAVAPSRWSNSWDLGASRAVSVVRFFQEKAGVDPSRLVALSFGEYRPLASNATEETRRQNRRVEIVLVERPLYQVQELVQSGR